jgi:hypothetical protein
LIKEELEGTNPTAKDLLYHAIEGASLKVNALRTSGLLANLRHQYLKEKNFKSLPEEVKKVIMLLLLRGSSITMNISPNDMVFLSKVLGKIDMTFQHLF